MGSCRIVLPTVETLQRQHKIKGPEEFKRYWQELLNNTGALTGASESIQYLNSIINIK